VNDPKRRIRIKKRPVGDVFETAESQNIASAKNSIGDTKKEASKKEVSKSITMLNATYETTTPLAATEASVVQEETETTTSRSATETTVTIPEEFTTQETTTYGSEEVTSTEPENIILGTSTTTEISLETEICYKGRCIKRKVDGDQIPIE
jgi:hypothetical protein